MPWVEYSKQSKITATLVDHGNPWDPGHTISFSKSIVYPDGGFARFNGWEIQLSEPCLVAFSTISGGTSKHASMYFDEAGFSAGDLSQNWVVQNGFVSLDNGADPGTWGPIQGSTIETDLVVYTPPEWLSEETPSVGYVPSYNLWLYIWEEEEAELIANDDEATTPHNTPVTVNVLGNDTLGDSLVTLDDLVGPPEIVTPPSIGSAVANPDGTITYTPPEGFTGEVEFQYRIVLPESCIHIEFSGGSGSGNNEFFRESDASPYPSWFDKNEPFEIDFGQGTVATYGDYSSDYKTFWLLSDSSPIYGEASGEGTLSQGGNSTCITWIVPPGH